MNDDLITHTINWYKGELFEARIFFLLGILLLTITFFLWRSGLTPNAKMLTIPTLILAILFIVIGIVGNQNNLKRIKAVPESLVLSPQKFIAEETIRIDKLSKIYLPIRYALCGLIISALVIFCVVNSPSIWKGISVAIIMGALFVLIGDYFSEEKTLIYQSYLRTATIRVK